MKARSIYVVGGDKCYASWMEGQIVPRMEDADLVLFTGGEDVTPALYGDRPHPKTYYNWKRDAAEVEEFKKAADLHKRMVGICRGSQFLCVAAGGRLVQHQYHPQTHQVFTCDGYELTVTSTHHQRQHPWPKNNAIRWYLMAWSDNISPFDQFEDEVDNKSHGPESREVEVALYPDIRALAIQSHPEYAYPPKNDWQTTYIRWCQHQLDLFLRGKLDDV